MTYRERVEARLARRRQWADSRATESTRRFDAVHKLADGIPLGQPILVGHHSERHARRDADRIHAGMTKACAAADMARVHTSKAGGLERMLDRSIFSDDADALDALRERIATMEAQRERMKTINKLYRKKNAAGLAAMGLDLADLQRRVARIGYSWVTAPYAAYQLSNLGGRITTDRTRLVEIEKRQTRAAQAETAGGVGIEEHGDYCRVTFSEKPDRATLDALKAAGFSWSGGSWAGRTDKMPDGVRPESVQASA